MRPRSRLLAACGSGVFVLGETGDILEREASWWRGRVVHVEREEDIGLVGSGTNFVHGEGLDLAFALRRWRNGGPA